MNILPGRPLRKQVRKAADGRESTRGVRSEQEELGCGPAPTPFTLIFCFAAVSRTEREPKGSDAHDSLQMTCEI